MRTPTPPSSPSEIPLIDRLRASTAGRYTIHSELGVGGMATVFRATEIALEREVAIKVMSAEMASTPGAFERFRREARVAAALSHPHIVPIYAIGEDPKLAYFAMKFIEGRGLDSILKKEPVQPVESVVRTIATVGRALAAAHEKGVVHRDVKPANVMIGNDGWIYVTDFGIAKRDDAQGLTQAGTVIGTPAYMSPEQFNGVAITGAADQYSLGIVAYEMLAGRAPFNGPSLGEIMRGHLLEPPPPLRTLRVDVPTGIVDVVHRMLEKEPGKRFPSLADAATALEAAGAGLKGAPARRTVPTASAGVPQPTPHGIPIATATAAAEAARAAMSPTTPIPRSNPSIQTSGVRRTGTASVPRAPEPEKRSGPALLVFLLLAAAGGGGWYLFGDEVRDAMKPAPVAAIAPVADSVVAPPAAPVADSAVAGADTGTAARDSTTKTPEQINAEIAELAARLASAPVMDANAPAESVVVRIGSQTMQTVLFVNQNQIGILGGQGLVGVTVAPGPVSISVRKQNCQAWDTTFTPVTGRRYTFVERSPKC